MTYIVYAIPAFLILMAVEIVVGLIRGRNTYRINDAVASLGTGVLMITSSVLTTALRVGIYVWVWSTFALFELPTNSALVWLGGLLGYDLCYYWFHRLSHERNILWAAHAVHHQSEDYNLSTALRQTSTGFLFGWIFYLPLAVAGVPPMVYAVVAGINLLYQFWPHTQHIPKLGWIDRVLVTASNHRVHHAQNPEYIDRNYGGILILWDRLFGTFVEEQDDIPIIYGVRKPLNSWNPLWANIEVYWRLLEDAWRTTRWRDRLTIWVARTGWRPPDVARDRPRPSCDLDHFRRFDTDVSAALAKYVCLQFALVIAFSVVYLLKAPGWALATQAAGLLLIVLALISLGCLLERRTGAAILESSRLVVSVALIVAGVVPLMPA